MMASAQPPLRPGGATTSSRSQTPLSPIHGPLRTQSSPTSPSRGQPLRGKPPLRSRLSPSMNLSNSRASLSPIVRPGQRPKVKMIPRSARGSSSFGDSTNSLSIGNLEDHTSFSILEDGSEGNNSSLIFSNNSPPAVASLQLNGSSPSTNLDQMQLEIATLKSARDNAVKRWKETAVKLNELSVEFARLQQTKNAMQQELQEMKGYMDDMHGSFAVLEVDKTSMAEQLGASQNLILDLQLARDEAVHQRVDTGDKLRKLRETNSQLRGKNRSLTHELREAKEKLETVEAELSKFKKGSNSSGTDLEQALNRVSELEKENAGIKSDYAILNIQKAEDQRKAQASIQSLQDRVLLAEENTANMARGLTETQVKTSAKPPSSGLIEEMKDDKDLEIQSLKSQHSKELEKYQRKTAKLLKEHKQLTDALKDAKSIVQKAREGKERYKQHIQQLQSENEVLEGKLLSSTTVEQTLGTRAEHLEVTLQESRKETTKLKAILEKQERRIKQLEADIKDSQDDHITLEVESKRRERKLQDELETIRAEKDRLHTEIGRLKELNGKADEAIARFSKEVATLQEDLARREDSLDQATAQLTSARSELESIKSQNVNLTQELGSTKSTTAAAEASLRNDLANAQASAKQAEEKMRHTLNDMQLEMATKDRQNIDIARLKEEIESELGEARKTIETLSKTNDELVREREAKHGELESLRSDFLGTKRENESLQNRIISFEGIKDDYNTAKATIRMLEDASVAAASELRQLGHKLEESDEKLEIEKKKVDKRTSETERFRFQYHELRRKHESVVKASRDAAIALSRQLDERTGELDTTRSRLKSLADENLFLEEKLRKVENQKHLQELELREAQRKQADLVDSLNHLRSERGRKKIELEEIRDAQRFAQESLKSSEAHLDSLRRRLELERVAKDSKIAQLTQDLRALQNEATETENQMNGLRVRLRELGTEKRSLSEAYVKELSALRRRKLISEDLLRDTRRACDEMREQKDQIDMQKKNADAEIARLREAVASQDKLAESLERKRRIAQQRLAEKARTLEEQLSSTAMEQERLVHQLAHSQGRHRESQATIASLRSSLDLANSELTAVNNAHSHILYLSGHPNIPGDPVKLVEKVKRILESALESRNDAVTNMKEMERALEQSKTKNSTLKLAAEEAHKALEELQNSYGNERENLLAQLQRLEDTLSDNEGLVKKFKAELEKIEAEKVKLQDDLLQSNRTLDSLQNLLIRSKEDAAKLTMELEDRGAVNGVLKKSLDDALAAIDDVQGINGVDNDICLQKKVGNASTRLAALELALADRDRKLQQAKQQVRLLDVEKQALLNDTVILKEYLGEALVESKQILLLFMENLEPETNHLLPTKREHITTAVSARRDAFARLESIVKRMQTELDNLNKVSASSSAAPPVSSDIDFEMGELPNKLRRRTRRVVFDDDMVENKRGLFPGSDRFYKPQRAFSADDRFGPSDHRWEREPLGSLAFTSSYIPGLLSRQIPAGIVRQSSFSRGQHHPLSGGAKSKYAEQQKYIQERLARSAAHSA